MEIPCIRVCSPFGLFFAGFGEYPAALGFAAAGTMLLSARNREKRLVGVLQIIGGCWFVLSGAAMAAMLPKGYLDISTACRTGAGSYTESVCSPSDSPGVSAPICQWDEVLLAVPDQE